MAVNEIVEQLRAEETRLEQEKTEIAASLKTIDDDLKRVRGALRELGQKASTKTKPAATKKVVIAAIEAVLQDQGVVEKDALKTVVEAKLTEAGKSRQGFALRFEEALKDDRFVDSPSGYRLKTEESNVTEDDVVPA